MPTIKEIVEKRIEKLLSKIEQHTNDTVRQTVKEKHLRKADAHVGPIARITR